MYRQVIKFACANSALLLKSTANALICLRGPWEQRVGQLAAGGRNEVSKFLLALLGSDK